MKTNKTDIAQEYFKTTHLAKITGLSSQTFRREIKSGRLPAIDFHGEFLIRRRDFEDWKAKYFKTVA